MTHVGFWDSPKAHASLPVGASIPEKEIYSERDWGILHSEQPGIHVCQVETILEVLVT
jgi:hypothetical protein